MENLWGQSGGVYYVVLYFSRGQKSYSLQDFSGNTEWILNEHFYFLAYHILKKI